VEENVKLTKLAKCAGCGAKVGAGVLAQLLEGIQVHKDPNLLVGFDKSDDASVYKVSDELALVQTLDFFPPIADDPYTFGQIAATNALSDIYAMGGDPKLALNIMCVPEDMPKDTVHQILRGGYEKVYEAGGLITGGATGIALAIGRLTGLPVSGLLFFINLAMLVWGWVVLGRAFALNTLASSVLSPAFLALFSQHPAVSPNYLLFVFHPLHLFCLPWMINKVRKRQKSWYMRTNCAVLTLFILLWAIIPQRIDLAVLPLALCLLVRSASNLILTLKKR